MRPVSHMKFAADRQRVDFLAAPQEIAQFLYTVVMGVL